MDSFLDLSLATTATLYLILAFLAGKWVFTLWKGHSNLPPAVPGLPFIGNLHQLKAKIPHNTFAKWAEIYGPIYSVRLGSSTMVVLNSAELAKEIEQVALFEKSKNINLKSSSGKDCDTRSAGSLSAMVTKFSSISTRRLSKALTLLTCQKSIVALSDYGEYHKMVKRYAVTSVLGANAQKRNRGHRDTLIENSVSALFADIADDPHNAVKLRAPFQAELFRLALKQGLGNDVESIYVEDLGVTMSKQEIFNVLVVDPMMGAIEVDWRDFFPYLRWVPNKSMEEKIHSVAARKRAVTKALIMEQKKRISRGEEISCYLDFLVSKESTLTEDQLIALVWEEIIETSDTTLVPTEWAMYELAKNPMCQDRLYQEIQEVCGSEKITEKHLQRLPYLNAVFHETLRYHSPSPIIPPRYVHEDITLGGYHVPAGTDITVNLYACNMNKKDWDEADEWKPERFLSSKYDQMDMYKTMAFGGGKRVCAGSLQAYLISCTAIGRFVQEFQWRLREGEEENVVTVQLTTHKLHPMQAYITPRKS